MAAGAPPEETGTMLVAKVGQGPRTERARATATRVAGRGWVDPASARPAADGPSARAPLAGGPVAPLVGLDALLVLQRVEEPGERRRRAARQGERLLDGLAALHRGLLDGAIPEARLHELRRALAELEATPDHPRLQAVLDAIAVRVEVELAKLERAAQDEPTSPAAAGERALTLTGR
ncbi:MAG: hypothetical protein K6T74_14240 [Geminicoccaceae bacterium]|nr:hypothetical protein [Geminicoccaceae bacterium]